MQVLRAHLLGYLAKYLAREVARARPVARPEESGRTHGVPVEPRALSSRVRKYVNLFQAIFDPPTSTC